MFLSIYIPRLAAIYRNFHAIKKQSRDKIHFFPQKTTENAALMWYHHLAAIRRRRKRLPRKLPKHRLACLFCVGLCVSPLHYTK